MKMKKEKLLKKIKRAELKLIVRHYRKGQKDNPIGKDWTKAILLDKNGIQFPGRSIVHPKDQFCRHTGWMKAVGRAYSRYMKLMWQYSEPVIKIVKKWLESNTEYNDSYYIFSARKEVDGTTVYAMTGMYPHPDGLGKCVFVPDEMLDDPEIDISKIRPGVSPPAPYNDLCPSSLADKESRRFCWFWDMVYYEPLDVE